MTVERQHNGCPLEQRKQLLFSSALGRNNPKSGPA